MTMIFINDEKLCELREFALKNVIEYEETLKILNKKVKCVGDRDGYFLFMQGITNRIPTQYKVVYSIEWTPFQGKQKVKLQRMSISVLKNESNDKPQFIDWTALNLIATKLGFASLESGEVAAQVNENHPIPHILLCQTLEIKDI